MFIVSRCTNSNDFLRRAKAEAERYGDDPWVFLRELGQNSRDAYAGRIQVASRVENGTATLVFSDDGRGMTLQHARDYLFRLYASSKDDDTTSAGRFGVGFWSVLRFGPTRIEIHSRCDGEAWGVALTGDLTSWERLECRRSRRGTSVVLARELPEFRADVFADELHRGLVRYLAHLRTAGLRPRPLQVLLDGRRVERPFSLESPGALRFRDGPVEGVVGFGPRPAYTLYARGLPVVRGAFLDELEGNPSRAGPKTEREGVAPVYVLNGNNLDVVLSRQTVVENRALKELLRVARRRFDELVSRTIDGSVRPSPAARLASLVSGLFRSFGRGPFWLRIGVAVMVLLLAGGLLGLASVSLHEPDPGRTMQVEGRPAPIAAGGDPVAPASPAQMPGPPMIAAFRPGDLSAVRTGTVVSAEPLAGWDFWYHPEKDLLFRQSLLDRFDPALGWQASGEAGPWRPAPRVRGAGEGVEIGLRLGGRDVTQIASGPFILPVPSGYVPVGGSGRMGRKRVAIEINPQGMARARVPGGSPAPLRYRVVERRGVGADLVERMSRAPPVRLPASIERRIEGWEDAPVGERIEAAVALVQALMAYDRSPETVRMYERRVGPTGDWAVAVLEIKTGDCDVLNGLLVLVLRRVGVPARMVAGIVGRDGRGLPGWHAWVEVVESGRITTLDASAGASRSSSTGPVGTAGVDAVERRGTDGRISTTKASTGGAGDRSSWIGLILLAAAIVLILLLVVCGIRHSAELRVTADDKQRGELLAGMAADAIRRPDAWKDVHGIWHRSFLPCLGGGFISLARLVRLCRSERAFVGSTGCELAAEARRCGQVVLAADDPHFGQLYSRTANLRDLDELARHKPVARPKGISASLLRELDRVLRSCRVGAVCRAVPAGGSGKASWDVDLRPIRPRRKSGWPRRFVAVDTAHAWWRMLEDLFREAPGTAVAVAMDRLASESRLLWHKAASLRRAAARQALGGR